MATCKDCIHNKICKHYVESLSKSKGIAFDSLIEPFCEIAECDDCKYFQDRSKFVELPCELGDVQKFVDKATPKKVVLTISTIRCPSCNKQLTNRGCSHSDYKFCRWCGQAIDWSEV